MRTLLPLIAIFIILPYASSDASPLVMEIPWNTTHSYGPDGPWPVVTVQVGTVDGYPAGTQPLSTVDLHPGGIWESMIFRKAYCNTDGTNYGDDSSPCLANYSGLYYALGSETLRQNFTDAVGLVWQWGSSAAENVLDVMAIPALQGAFTVFNSTISAVQAWQIELPDGTKYSAQVGTLSLGAPGTGIQPFSATVTGQTVPRFANAQGTVASNSWGMHYGSASLSLEGSLVFGGYDQTRVLGDIGVFGLGAGSELMANLLDVQIGVENGTSPFSEGLYTGLLKLNASFNGVQPAIINPILPYFFMSPETCHAIVENLPVTFNSQVGLYIWDVTDPQYEKIVKSPSYLAFIFQNAESGNLTIKVPFQLLNLTLEAPIVVKPQQYFPCRPFYATDHSGNYFLSKAFLQAAFIGTNWEIGRFFLAQAPGPGVGSSNIIPIDTYATPNSTDPIEKFGETWARDWTVLSDTGNNKTLTINPTSGTVGQQGTSNTGNVTNSTGISTNDTNGLKGTSGSGLSSKTKAGVSVGATVGALVVAGMILLYCLRVRKTAVPRQDESTSQVRSDRIYKSDGRATAYEVGRGRPHEAGSDLIYQTDGKVKAYEFGRGLPHEADADHEIYELDVTVPP